VRDKYRPFGIQLNLGTDYNVWQLQILLHIIQEDLFQVRHNITANDEESRDPKSWTVAGSNNGTTWTTLSTVSGFNATVARNTWQTAQTY
jgi:hypothetical protein